MEKRELCFIAMAVFMLFYLGQAGAQSMAGISPSSYDIPFSPLKETTIIFRPIGYDAAEFEMKCPYTHVNNETLYDEDGIATFSVTVRLPDKIDAMPGIYPCGFIMHRPKNPNLPPGIGASAEIGANINILIPEKGKHAAIGINTENVNKGEPVYFKVNVRNLGDEDLYGLAATIYVQDINNKTLQTLYTTTADAPRFGSIELWKRMETDNFEPAKYKAKAILHYGGEKPAEAATEFLIGKLFVHLTGFEINATAGKINPFTVDVESWWGNPIENVYAEFAIYGANGTFAGDFKTESIDLSPWQKARLKGYWDANGLEPGIYDAKIAVKYKGGQTNEAGRIILQMAAVAEKQGISFEKAKELLTSPLFLAVLVLILMVNIAVWYMQRKRGRKQNETD